jgi:hypothetical protein
VWKSAVLFAKAGQRVVDEAKRSAMRVRRGHQAGMQALKTDANDFDSSERREDARKRAKRSRQSDFKCNKQLAKIKLEVTSFEG